MRIEPDSNFEEMNAIDLAAGDVFRPIGSRDARNSLYIVVECSEIPLRLYVNLWTGKSEEINGRVFHFPNAAIRTYVDDRHFREHPLAR